MHKDIYSTGHKLSKRDKLGIHQHLENICLNFLALLIEAAFSKKESKLKVLEIARVRIEQLKNILRTESELDIIDDKTYLRIAENVVEASKMLNRWISYILKP